jgi:hypothetical protein
MSAIALMQGAAEGLAATSAGASSARRRLVCNQHRRVLGQPRGSCQVSGKAPEPFVAAVRKSQPANCAHPPMVPRRIDRDGGRQAP